MQFHVNARIDSTKFNNRIDYSLNFTIFKGNRGSNFFHDNTSKYSKEIDLNIRYFLTRKFYLRPTLLVSKFNFEYLPNNYIYVNEKFSKLRILLPFGIKFPLEKHHLFLEAGLGYNLLLREKVYFIDKKNIIETNNYNNIPSSYLRNDQQARSLIRVSGGFSIKMSQTVSLNFAFFLENSNVFTYKQTPPYSEKNLKYTYWGFSIGLLYGK